MRYGYFDDVEREYVITQPDTPLPWINYLGSQAYFCLISNTAGGYSFYKDARLRRISRYRYNNAPLDCSGRYIYLRDDGASAAQAEALFWSPSWQPTRTLLDTSQLSVFSSVEFNLWDAMDDATNFQRNYNVGEVEVADGIIYHKTEYRERRDHFAYLACSEPIAGFDTQREAFLGPYRGYTAPVGVESGRLSDSIAHGWQPIGAQHIKVELQAGESKTIVFLLGYHENPHDAKFDPPESQTINKRLVLPTIQKYLQTKQIEESFQELRSFWDGMFGKFQVTTPDTHTNRMVNIWNVYQMMVTFNLSRSASYFESGIGRGMGFRDSNQDLLGFMHLLPERARERILDLAATQMPTGGAYHQYQPLTKRGNNDVGSNFNDDPLWLILSVAAYLKETGDWEILDEAVPYENLSGTEEPIYGHLQRSIQYTLDRLGPHGLPLIGRADWNDCLNLNCFSESPGQSFQTTTNKDGKVAESVFIAGLFVLAAQEMQAIANHRGDAADEKTYIEAAEKMAKAVWTAGWDGEWFRRAYDDMGRVLGSRENDEGQIFIEPQGICVMAGLGLEDGRALQALDSVAEQLKTPHGIHGEAKNSWLTGTAAWNYVAITQWILGIRPTYAGLEIDPVLPSDWDGFEAVRYYRGVRYRIKIERHGSGSNVRLEVNGSPIDGRIIPLPGDKTRELEVLVSLG
ncbi:MAG: glycosyl transferase [Anaerolineales bacterium]